MSDKVPDLEVQMPSGNTGRVRFKTHGDSIAAGVMWAYPPTPEDIRLFDAAILEAITPHLDPNVEIVRAGYCGQATEAQHEAVLNRFVKAGDN
jgi:hypothetical protein